MRTDLSLCLALTLSACASSPADVNELSRADVRDGWELLFDGESLAHWRGFRQEGVPEGWAIEDDAIALIGAGAGDLITHEEFSSFELVLQWRIAPRANSGIMFHVSEEFDATYFSGPEMQVLDNAVFDGDVNPVHMAGANYALHAPENDDTRPVGEWNDARIVVDGAHVEHWLNGVQQCSYELWSDDWKALVEASKFKQWPGYGMQRGGHIALQDHGNRVWYRGIRIKRL
ncbi:MAG: DUF1080 domain-containing protein [bacterium]|nr:DUF1080 domain-containing protein [bacterium]